MTPTTPEPPSRLRNRRAQDATLINIDHLKAEQQRLEARIEALSQRVVTLEAAILLLAR